jgi:hypothetical protein
MSTAVVALLLVPVALALVAALLLLLTRPFLEPATVILERARFRRGLARAARGDAHLQAGHIDSALREFESAFALFTVRVDGRLPEQIARHHVGLLSRLLTVADESPRQRVRPLALAKVDRLLDRRSDMQRAYLQLRGRSRGDGRRSQLERELRSNALDIRAAVRELVADLQLLRDRKVAYH